MRAAQVLPLLLLACAISCSTTQTQSDPTKLPPPTTTLEVRNQKHVDFIMYVLDGTHRIRLGLVPAMGTRTFTIPHHLVSSRGSLRFQADTVGSQSVLATDEELTVHEGDAFSLTIR
ncbi:hypothetical protein [Hyalangium sp.]|uniref:hypothetical protein n=1 Tax=Hyalangium sp. TaxID=2028555 RepID=UPI002D345D09|nr:hypothetical protein [Hyalangium sp.]HYH98591.1 hypothetical protein [Hyalangium sp.]